MLTAELRGKVGVAPGTTTVTLGDVSEIPEITEGQFRYQSIQLQQQDLAMRGSFWSKLGAIGTGGIAIIALVGAVAAWVRTGRIQVVK